MNQHFKVSKKLAKKNHSTIHSQKWSLTNIQTNNRRAKRFDYFFGLFIFALIVHTFYPGFEKYSKELILPFLIIALCLFIRAFDESQQIEK